MLTELLSSARYVKHLEEEIQYLRGRVGLLEIQLDVARNPKPAPARVPVPATFPNFPPIKTSWEAYRDAEMERQEKEANGKENAGS